MRWKQVGSTFIKLSKNVSVDKSTDSSFPPPSHPSSMSRRAEFTSRCPDFVSRWKNTRPKWIDSWKGSVPVQMGLYCCHCSKPAIFHLKSTTRTWSCKSTLLFVVHSTSLSPLQSCNYCMVNSFPEPIISCTVSFLFCACDNRGAELLSIYWY